MTSRHRLAEVASLLSDPGRVAIATALLDGSARPAGELARVAGVSAATASGHLAKLVAGGLLRVEARGRHRYYRLAEARVAHALESLVRLLPPRDVPGRDDQPMEPLRRARLCYDHLAGHLGVSVSDALASRRLLTLGDGAYSLTSAGRRWFERLGIAVAPLEAGRRPLLLTCLDWTERREHLAGALGAALATHLLERDWLRRQRGTRVLIVTRAGRMELKRALGLRIE